MKRTLFAAFVGAIGIAVVVPAAAASAHPMGNFTINQFSGLHVSAGAITVDLVTDEAEIPAFQARSEMDLNNDGTIDEAESARWRGQACADAATHTRLALDGRNLTVHAETNASLTFPPGQAGLQTLRLECTLEAPVEVAVGAHSLAYENTGFDGRLGWHEIVGPSTDVNVLSTDVATTSVTDRLTHYPSNELRSPPQQRTANVRFQQTVAASGSTPPVSRPASVVSSLLPAWR